MKKIYSLLLTVIILVCCGTIAVHADSNSVTVTPSLMEVERGGTVSFTVSLNTPVAKKAGGFQIAYDDTVLDIDTNIEWLYTNTSYKTFVQSEDSAYNYQGAFMAGAVISGNLVRITFTVANDAPFETTSLKFYSSFTDTANDDTGVSCLNNVIITVICPHTNTSKKEAVAPTCQTPGYTEGVYCNDCQTYINGYVEISASSEYHSWPEKWTSSEGKGEHERICQNGCNEKQIEAHDWKPGERIDSSCDKDGSQEYSCFCGATKTETISATGKHVYGNWKKQDEQQHIGTCTTCTGENPATITEDHTWDEGEITTEPSCVDGVKTFECTAKGCEGSYTEAVPATGNHVWGDGEYIDATNHQLTCIGCKTTTKDEAHYYDNKWMPIAGDATKHIRYCASCGDGVTQKEGAFETEAHSFGEWTYDSETGIATHKCKCGATETCDHDGKWDDGEITTAPKCEETGVMTYKCSNCAGTKTETIPELGHNFENSEWKQVDNKYHQRSCANEGCEEVDRAEHDWSEGEKEQQYVCHDGIQHYSCEICHGTKTEVIKAEDHKFGDWEDNKDGMHKHTCEECGDSETAKHNWDEGEVQREPGTNGKDDPGEALYTCEDCGATELRELHTHEFAWKSDAEKHWKECECGDVEEGTTERHDLDEGVIVSNATHTQTGLSSHKCEVCGATIEKTIAKTSNHSYGGWRPYGPNEHVSSCACGAIKTAAHSFGAWTVTKAATTTAEGVETRTCSGCGYADTRSIAKLPEVTTTAETTTEETTTAETTTAETTTAETTTETTTVETTTETTTAETTTETTTVETTTAETTTVETTTAETTTIGDEKHEIEVKKNVWKPGKKDSDEGMTFRSHAEFKDFIGVRVDGVEISRDLYEVREGSTIVVLNAQYLEELATGTHTIDIVSVTGVASASFEIAESGNGGWIAPVCIAVVLVGVIAVGVVYFLRKKKKA